MQVSYDLKLKKHLDMKNIIVGTDFSLGSEKALSFGVMLANNTKADLTLLWVDDSPSELATVEYQEVRKEGQDEIDKLVRKYEPLLKTGGNINAKIRKGKTYRELIDCAEQTPESVLVMGTHGVTGFQKYWIGTNAFRVIATANVPVITVRASHNAGKNIKRIILPIDHTSVTLNKVEKATELAAMLNADICLLGINESGLRSVQKFVDVNLNKAANILAKKDISHIVEQVNSHNIGQAIIEHTNSLQADLIIVTVELQQKTRNGMPSALMQQLINFSPVPVLSIYPNI